MVRIFPNLFGSGLPNRSLTNASLGTKSPILPVVLPCSMCMGVCNQPCYMASAVPQSIHVVYCYVQYLKLVDYFKTGEPLDLLLTATPGTRLYSLVCTCQAAAMHSSVTFNPDALPQ